MLMRIEDIEIKGTLLEEQETIIQWYRGDRFRVYTCDPTFLTKLKKILVDKEYHIERVTSRSVQLTCGLDCILIGRSRK